MTIQWKNIRRFASVVRSPDAVRNAFANQGLLSWWWQLVLRLHGQPVPNRLTANEWCACVRDGFRFYGWLYRGLAIILGGAAILGWCAGVKDVFWLNYLPAGGIYLWLAGGLAITGAKTYCDTNGKRPWPLVAFLFFVSLFLAVTLTVFSTQANFCQWLPDTINLFLTLGLLMFGVGSYLIELAALLANETN